MQVNRIIRIFSFFEQILKFSNLFSYLVILLKDVAFFDGVIPSFHTILGHFSVDHSTSCKDWPFNKVSVKTKHYRCLCGNEDSKKYHEFALFHQSPYFFLFQGSQLLTGFYFFQDLSHELVLGVFVINHIFKVKIIIFEYLVVLLVKVLKVLW